MTKKRVLLVFAHPDDETLPVKKLYHATIPLDPPVIEHNGRTLYGDLPERITTDISEPSQVEKVTQALLAHRTQHAWVERVFPGISHGGVMYLPRTTTFWHGTR